MAGDWSPLRTNIRRDIRTLLMATRLGVSAFDVVGRLHEFWSWSQDHTSDGLLPRASTALIDTVVELPGFAEAMLEAGWLEMVDDEIPFIPEWDTWNGRGAKRRLQDTKRKRDVRSESPSTTPPRPKSAACPQDVRKVSASEADKKRTTGQDSTVNTPQVPSEPTPPAGGGTSKKPKRSKVADWRAVLAEPEFADLAAHPEFPAAWEVRVRERSASRHKPLTDYGTRLQFRAALEHGIPAMLKAIEVANKNGSQGIFPEKFAVPVSPSAPTGRMNAADAAELWRAQHSASQAAQEPREVDDEGRAPLRILGEAQ